MNGPFTPLLDLLFPPRCAFCGKLLVGGEQFLCAKCQQTLPWLAGSTAERKGEFYANCVSPLCYQDSVRKSIHRYKFGGLQGYAEGYGNLVAQCVRDHLAGEYDLITWVPLSKKRLRERGYDQTFLLARATARALGDVATATLRKMRNTNAQSGLDGAEARRANVLGVYEALSTDLVAGKRVLLIDDVVTTGATLSECARTLRTAGASQVICATLACVK